MSALTRADVSATVMAVFPWHTALAVVRSTSIDQIA
jgi:hypothetical protein